MAKNNLLFIISETIEATYWYKDGNEDNVKAVMVTSCLSPTEITGDKLFAMAVKEMTSHGLDPERNIHDLRIVLASRCTSLNSTALIEFLENKGVDHVVHVNIDDAIGQVYEESPYSIVISSDGVDLYLTVHGTSSKATGEALILKGEGGNKQIISAAECAWNKLRGRYAELEKEKVFAKIISNITPLVEGKAYEIDVRVNQDGRTYSCHMDTDDIPNIAPTDMRVFMETISKWLNTNGIMKTAECALVLGHGVAENQYFEEMFSLVRTNFKGIVSISTDQELLIIINSVKGASLNDGFAPWLPDGNVSSVASEVDIVINVTIPKGVAALRLLQGTSLLKNFNKSKVDEEEKVSYTVTGLEPGVRYVFTLEVVKLNEKGDELVSKSPLEVTTLSLSSCIEDIDVSDEDSYTEISWKKPDIGKVKLYLSKTPFKIQDRNVRMESLSMFEELTPTDNHLRIQKTFCGERFVLPVRVYGSSARTGVQIRIESLARPQGVRLEAVNLASPKVYWKWGELEIVRIKWETNTGGYERSVDLVPSDAPAGSYTITDLPAGTHHLKVSVCALSKTSNGGDIQSSYVSEEISLELIKVEFVSAKRRKGGFLGLGKRDDYEITIRCVNGVPASDLIIIADENQIPMRVNNYPALMTFAQGGLQIGRQVTQVLTYKKANKNATLHLRLVVADRNQRSAVNIIPNSSS